MAMGNRPDSSFKPTSLRGAAKFKSWDTMRVAVTLLLVSLISCSCAPMPESLCNVARAPDRFLGTPLTISGTAKMSRHGTTLSDPACPDLGLGLEGSGGSSDFSGALWGTLAPNRGGIRVKVTGQLTRSSELPSYVFHVATGVVE